MENLRGRPLGYVFEVTAEDAAAAVADGSLGFEGGVFGREVSPSERERHRREGPTPGFYVVNKIQMDGVGFMGPIRTRRAAELLSALLMTYPPPDPQTFVERMREILGAEIHPGKACDEVERSTMPGLGDSGPGGGPDDDVRAQIERLLGEV